MYWFTHSFNVNSSIFKFYLRVKYFPQIMKWATSFLFSKEKLNVHVLYSYTHPYADKVECGALIPLELFCKVKYK